jgi:HemY protein
MIRVVIYLLIVAGLAFGAVWFADRPGEVAITWQGWRIDTSVMVAAAAVAAVVVAAVLLWSLVRALIRSPDVLSLYLRTRRGVRGYNAVSHGLVAVASGDVRAARKFSDEANRIAPGEPLTLLLGAQAAQLSGDRAAAERAFHVMAGRDDTKLLGLHGLYIEAQRRDDPVAARLYAEEAAAEASPPAWAGQAALEFRCASGDWTGALDRLERNQKSGLTDKASYRRQRAVLLTARALAAAETDRARAREFAIEAVRFAPTLVPAAALAGRLLGEAGELRKAARLIEAAWKENPHPALADAYAHLRPGDSARERLARIETLAAKSPGNIEGALAVARAALDAREFAVAREALRPLAIVPTRRVAALMAELEEAEHGDEGRAREWMARALTSARRDPAWTADGFVSERWLPVSPVTHRLDAFAWKDPLSGFDAGATIEADRHQPPLGAEARSAPAAEGPTVLDLERERESAADARSASGEGDFPRAERFEPTESVTPLSARRARSLAPVAVAPAVIPLVHVPDDPGPDAEPPVEPAPEPASEPPSDGWSRIRALFKP